MSNVTCDQYICSDMSKMAVRSFKNMEEQDVLYLRFIYVCCLWDRRPDGLIFGLHQILSKGLVQEVCTSLVAPYIDAPLVSPKAQYLVLFCFSLYT